MRLCKPGTGIRRAEMLSSHVFICDYPLTTTRTLTIRHGTHARMTSARLCACATCAVGPLPSPGNSHTRAGCQTFRKNTTAPSDTIDDTTSTSHGPWKFEMRNCGTANDTPETRIAGQTDHIPRTPANAQISQNGTITEKTGN